MKKKLFVIQFRVILVVIAVIQLNISFARDIKNNVFIEGTINSTSKYSHKKEIIISKCGAFNIYNDTTKFRFPIIENKFKGAFYIHSYGFYIIEDGGGIGGHVIFIQPNDSLKIDLKTIPDLEEKLKNIYFSTFYTLSASNKLWGNLLFFDNLGEKGGYVKYNANHSTPLQYKQSCDTVMINAIALLNEYKARNIISNDFYKYALIKIHCDYATELCRIVSKISRDKFPLNYFENIDINELKHNDEALKIIGDNFLVAANMYNIYCLNLKTYDYQIPYSNLENEYNSALKFYNGHLRDKVLQQRIITYSDKPYPNFSSIYQRFKVDCRDPVIQTFTKRIVEENALKHDLKKWPSVLSTATVKNREGKSITLSDLFNGKKYIVLDVWATWCVPCIKQKPFIEAFEKKYQDSVNFIYLSVDKDSTEWKAYIKDKKLDSSNQFFLDKSFESVFSTFLLIDYIPRYIFLKNGGNLIFSRTMPIPINKDAFDAIIKEGIK